MFVENTANHTYAELEEALQLKREIRFYRNLAYATRDLELYQKIRNRVKSKQVQLKQLRDDREHPHEIIQRSIVHCYDRSLNCKGKTRGVI